MGKWIDIKEQSPPDYKGVLVQTKNHEIYYCHLNSDGQFIFDFDGYKYVIKNITHWRKLKLKIQKLSESLIKQIKELAGLIYHTPAPYKGGIVATMN